MSLVLKVDSAGGRGFIATLHFAVLADEELLAASVADSEAVVQAVTSSIIEGRNAMICDDQRTIYLRTLPGGSYRRVIKASGDVFHGVILAKNCVFNDDPEAPVILAPNGDIKAAVGRYLAARYALPPEWEAHYLELIDPDYVTDLQVVMNPLNQRWRHLKAVWLSNTVTEEYMLDVIKKRLQNRTLLIPQLPGGVKGVFNPSWNMAEYLKANASILADKLKAFRPRHDPAKDPLNPAIAELKRIPFPAQAHMIQGLNNTLVNQNTAFCSGDMGTGKSIVALGVAHLLHKRRQEAGMKVLLVAPGITIPKWADKEIRETLPDAKVRIINSSEDAAAYLRQVRQGYRPAGLEFTLVGLDRAKLGPDPWCAAVWKRVAGQKYMAWHCPDCGRPLRDKDGKDYDWNDLAYGRPPEKTLGFYEIIDIQSADSDHVIYRRTPNGFPVGYEVKWKTRNPIKKCTECGAKLWRPAVKSRGETKNRPRWYVSRILKKLGRHFDLYIQDEIHQTKAQDSGRGDAFAQMVKASKKTLALTGTLVNGQSTSIKEILWRSDPAELLAAGFDHKTGMIQWASRYGVLKHVTKVETYDTGVNTIQKRTPLQPKEEPGIAPQMTAQFLLHKTGFMELGDLGLPLVELKEIPVFIDFDEKHGKEYRNFHDRLYNACQAHSKGGTSGAWSKFIPATINYADRPDLETIVEFNDGDIVVAPSFPRDYYHAKERRLVELVQNELAEGRGCVIYCNYTSSYGVHQRVKEVLAAHGIRAEILESHVSPMERVEWLSRKEDEGLKVLICNMKLVEVGLDLLPWPTIIYYQLNYDINTVRQSSRRSWRIGQTRECRVYYLVYDGSQQMAQFLRLMNRRGHALLTEGRLDRSELAEFSRDAHSALAADLANCLAGEDTAGKWVKLASKDMDANLTLVSEARFQEVLHETQQALVKETLRLCGFQAENIRARKRADGRMGLPGMEVKLIVVEKSTGRGRKAVAAGQLAFGW